jgi:hypothetical protein
MLLLIQLNSIKRKNDKGEKMTKDQVKFEVGKIADRLTQMVTKRGYPLDKVFKRRLIIIRDELNLFISDYSFKDYEK